MVMKDAEKTKEWKLLTAGNRDETHSAAQENTVSHSMECKISECGAYYDIIGWISP